MKNPRVLITAVFVAVATVAPAESPALVSRPAARSISGSGASFLPQFSADGRFLLFVSTAKDLTTNDDLGRSLDVFRRDSIGSNTVLISASTNDVGGASADANFASASSNGSIVVFVSRADNLVTGDTNGADDVFWRDMAKGRTHLVSIDRTGRSPAEPQPSLNVPLSGNPLISADGNYIYFESRATNLTTTPDENGAVDVFRRMTWSNIILPVSRNAAGTAMAAGVSSLHGITPDGRYVLFSSTATNVADGVVTNALYLRDMAGGPVLWAGTNYAGFVAPALSESAQVIAFISPATDGYGYSLGYGTVIRVDRVAGTTETIGTATNLPAALQMSADGNTIAFMEAGTQQVAIWRSGAGMTRPDYGHPAGISADGSSVLVAPRATRLLGGTLEPAYEVLGYMNAFVLLRTNAAPEYIYAGASVEFAGSALSRDGSQVAFDSAGNDLVAGDFNAASDVFIKRSNQPAELLSRASTVRWSTSPSAITRISRSSVSSDGRFVVGVRDDDPSFLNDTNARSDVFLTDTASGSARALSPSSITNAWDGAPVAGGAPTTLPCLWPQISADGSTIVALRSLSTSIPSRFDIVITRGTNGVFPTGMVLARPPGGMALDTYTSPGLSGDGRLMAFSSTAMSLVPEPDANWPASDVFVRNYYTNGSATAPTMHLISRSTNGATGGGPSSSSAITMDGRWVTFLSQASDLVLPVAIRTNALYPQVTSWPYNAPQLIAADLGTDRADSNFLSRFATRLCSYTIVTNRSGAMYPDPSMSFTSLKPLDIGVATNVVTANGRFAIFGLNNRVAIYRHDLLGVRTNWFDEPYEDNGVPSYRLVHGPEPGAPNVLVCTNCGNPSVNEDGSLVAFERIRAGTSIVDVYVADLQNGTETLLSVNQSGNPGNGSSRQPVLSGNGRFVVFESQASDLVANDINAFMDVFVRDRALGQTFLVSANPIGRSGDGPSANPVLGADGKTVVFQTMAGDIVPNDFNDRRDLVVVRLGGSDRDADGLDDDWEITYFGTLAREGGGDFDGDGISDRQEFQTGTDPTNSGSVFGPMRLELAGSGVYRLFWSGSPSSNYQIEYKDDLNDSEWHLLTAPIVWNGTTASITDSDPSPNRFYRVVRLP